MLGKQIHGWVALAGYILLWFSSFILLATGDLFEGMVLIGFISWMSLYIKERPN